MKPASENKDFGFISFSITVLAKDHNPSLLNPDFLKSQNIVSPEMKIIDTITTPPFSFVRYDTGLTINVELQKLQIIQLMKESPEEFLTISAVAQKYIETLPHVNYGAIGINWDSYIAKENPLEWIKKEFFLKRNNLETHSIGDMAIRMRFDLENVKCNLSISCSQHLKSEERSFPIVSIAVNYHHEAENIYPNFKKTIDIIGQWKDREKHLNSLLKDIFKVEI